MKNSSGGRPTAHSAPLVGACAGIAGFVGLGMGLALAFRQNARAAQHAEEALAQHRARLSREALRARRLEHDLRSPVGAMAVALELLRTSDDDELRREAMQVLERQVARMTSLTEQVREFAQGLDD
ncbi:histidine kinase dimerization/phospho-acceptor domain-containing protein [Variovorax paradoxus]|uniref:histidine kinase dimerization/phospho-acceptor domain-containing protein n=1 Tax=Variovorax paradoxus TaxID=34073 RepID=UPI003D65FAA4